MIEEKVEIVNRLGLHARAAAKLSHLANNFKSEVFLVYSGNRVNAKSLLGILTLAASVGNSISIQVTGEDKKECMDALKNLFANRFDEEC